VCFFLLAAGILSGSPWARANSSKEVPDRVQKALRETPGSVRVWGHKTQTEKEAAVAGTIREFQIKKGIVIRKAPAFYVRSIDALLVKYPKISHGLPVLIKYFAIRENDFEAEDKKNAVAVPPQEPRGLLARVRRFEPGELMVDGSPEDWGETDPVLKEVGAAEGDLPSVVKTFGVGPLWMGHDGERLFFLLSVSVPEDLKKRSDTDDPFFLEIFVDADHNRATGAQGVRTYRRDGYEINGAEHAIVLLNFTHARRDKRWQEPLFVIFDGVQIKNRGDGLIDQIRDHRNRIASRGAFVEFAVPLARIGLSEQEPFRMILKENRNFYYPQGYHDLEAVLESPGDEKKPAGSG